MGLFYCLTGHLGWSTARYATAHAMAAFVGSSVGAYRGPSPTYTSDPFATSLLTGLAGCVTLELSPILVPTALGYAIFHNRPSIGQKGKE